jgi:glycosidase
MKAVHQSRLSRYRHPYGALPALSSVTLAISLMPETHEIGEVTGVYLCYAYGLQQFQESRQRMVVRKSPDDLFRVGVLKQNEFPQSASQLFEPRDYVTTLTLPAEPGLFYYWFEIQTGNCRFFYTCDLYGDGSGWIGQHRPRFQPGDAPHPNPFLITVFNNTFSVPAWMIGAVMYQIFPDRFNRDAGFTPARFTAGQVDRPERIFHQDWHEDVDFRGQPETGYLACDFYGGSLRGIMEKLDYLQRFGVTILYLNPIFEARSNHRYDTADYERVDHLLGTNADLIALCSEASERGIHVVLDGVFSHTGADSRYFNKFGRYKDIGAYQEMRGQGLSRFTNWYTFHRKDDDLFYDSWWGFQDLPNVNEHDLSFREYITGPDGILRTWLKRGVSGFRLDVSDELPDNFLREIRRVVREENPDAAIIGEVWEDASHKISYGVYRDFLFGNTHDSIMGYPFQKALLDWLSQNESSSGLINLLETLRENYPLESFYSSMNLISSHDIPRAITILAGLPDPGSREAQARTHLSPPARRRGLALLRLAYLFQIAFPGIAAIYYGDEAGLEGYRDPFNRRTFPWGHEEHELQDWYSILGQLRRSLQVLKSGFVRLSCDGENVVIIERFLDLGRDIFGRIIDGPEHIRVAINRSPNPVTISWAWGEQILPGYGAILRSGQTELMTGLDQNEECN